MLNNTGPKRVKTEILYKPDLVVNDSLSHPDVNITLPGVEIAKPSHTAVLRKHEYLKQNNLTVM